jgi:hypothetical protein
MLLQKPALALSLSPQKAVPHWPPQVADHLVPNQVLGFFEFFRKREGGSYFFSMACKSLNRRRFKEFEDAPIAAYGTVYLLNKSNIFETLGSIDISP